MSHRDRKKGLYPRETVKIYYRQRRREKEKEREK